MASTITAATLTVTINESISLNGSQQGSTNTVNIASIAEISKRIDAASDTALGNLTNIQADANTGNCDLQMLIASV